MKKVVLIVNALLAAAIFAGNYFYLTEGGLWLKSLCSGGFALMGVVNVVFARLTHQSDLKFHISMACGLTLAMLGDVVLGFDFMSGAALFAAGHIAYFTAQCFLVKPKWPDIVVSGILAVGAGAFLLFCPLLQFPDAVTKGICLGYALIISLMAGKAIANVIREPNALTALLALGSMLFFFSDLMLVLDWFIGLWDWTGKLCMATYYPAECLLAFSVCYAAVRFKREK